MGKVLLTHEKDKQLIQSRKFRGAETNILIELTEPNGSSKLWNRLVCLA